MLCQVLNAIWSCIKQNKLSLKKHSSASLEIQFLITVRFKCKQLTLRIEKTRSQTYFSCIVHYRFQSVQPDNHFLSHRFNLEPLNMLCLVHFFNFKAGENCVSKSPPFVSLYIFVIIIFSSVKNHIYYIQISLCNQCMYIIVNYSDRFL